MRVTLLLALDSGVGELNDKDVRASLQPLDIQGLPQPLAYEEGDHSLGPQPRVVGRPALEEAQEPVRLEDVARSLKHAALGSA